MPHVFFGLTMAGVLALCAFRVLPSGEFVDIGKWVTILYAISTTMVAVVRHVWPRPAMTDAPTFTAPTWIEPDGELGVGLPGGFGSLHDDVFAGPIGHGVPPNYTSMVRDHDVPPVTTEGADGSPVIVPSESALPDLEPEVPAAHLGLLGVPPANRSSATPPLDFDGMFGPKPPIPHDYNRRSGSSPAAKHDPSVVILGDDQSKPG